MKRIAILLSASAALILLGGCAYQDGGYDSYASYDAYGQGYVEPYPYADYYGPQTYGGGGYRTYRDHSYAPGGGGGGFRRDGRDYRRGDAGQNSYQNNYQGNYQSNNQGDGRGGRGNLQQNQGAPQQNAAPATQPSFDAGGQRGGGQGFGGGGGRMMGGNIGQQSQAIVPAQQPTFNPGGQGGGSGVRNNGAGGNAASAPSNGWNPFLGHNPADPNDTN